MKNLRVTVEGKVYHVLVEMLDDGAPATPATASSAAAVPAPSPVAPASNGVSAPEAPPPRAGTRTAGGGGPGDVKSPLSGKVVSIDIKAGQPVAEGAQLLTVEAMKMNTYIYADRAGRVENLYVNAGDAVEEGQTLLNIA